MSQSLYFDIAIRGLIFLKNYLKIKTNKEEKMKKRGILYKTICQERTHAFNDCGVGEGDDVPCAYVMGEDGGVALVASSENGKTNSWPDGEEVVYDSFISTDGQHRQLMARNVWLARELKHVHALVAWVKEWVDLDKVSYELDPSSLIKTFRSLNFGLQPESVSGPLDQQEVVVNNLELNQKSCLGRLALAAAVAEKHFPGIKVFGAEVWEDGLRNRLLAMLKVDPSLADDPSFWRELLLYEEPHAVLYFQGRQYDPLETVLHEPIRHPRVLIRPVWNLVASSWLVSRHWLEDEEMDKRKFLAAAEMVCPGTMLAAGALLPFLINLQEGKRQAIALAEWMAKRNPTARIWYALHLITGDDRYLGIIAENYGEKIFPYLEEYHEK